MMNSLLRVLLVGVLVTLVFGRCEAAFAQSQSSRVEAPGLHYQYGAKLSEIQAYADGGDQEAQIQLAKAYLAGDLIPRDRVSAYFWFSLAAISTGSSAQEKAQTNEAKAELRKLEKVLTPAQVAQAEGMTRNWKAKDVLGSDRMKEAFARQFGHLLLTNGRVKPYFTDKLDRSDEGHYQNWATTIRFPGDNSFPCRGTTFGSTDEWLDCYLFSSLDVNRARAVFAAVDRYVWDLLPAGWYRGAEKGLEGTPLHIDSVCFSSNSTGRSQDTDPIPRGSFTVSLDNTDYVLGYSVHLRVQGGCFFKDLGQLEHR
jgi:hypothetical protein